MPVVQTIPPLQSPPTNVFGLYQYLAQRLPGYDYSEYVRELNSAYVHVWEEVTKLRNNYFAKTKQVTVQNPQFSYDLMYNADNGLSSVVSNRMYQIVRVRIQPPAGGLLQVSKAMHPNDPDFLAVAANSSSTPTQSGPYYWYQNGRNNITFALPLAVGTGLEIMYTFWPIAMTFLSQGTISSTGAAVTGSGTNFTQLVQPDFANNLPLNKDPEEILAELVCNGNQIYNVLSIQNDTTLHTLSTVAPVLSAGSPYVVATLPEIPREHIRVIASVAMAKMYSIAQDDERVREWAQIAAQNMQMMKDSLIERQAQDPPRKGRFQFGIGRRNRAFLR